MLNNTSFTRCTKTSKTANAETNGLRSGNKTATQAKAKPTIQEHLPKKNFAKGPFDPEEATNAGCSQQSHAGQGLVAHLQGDQGVADKGQRSHGAGQSVQAVNDVDGVGPTAHGKSVEDDGNECEVPHPVHPKVDPRQRLFSQPASPRPKAMVAKRRSMTPTKLLMSSAKPSKNAGMPAINMGLSMACSLAVAWVQSNERLNTRGKPHTRGVVAE